MATLLFIACVFLRRLKFSITSANRFDRELKQIISKEEVLGKEVLTLKKRRTMIVALLVAMMLLSTISTCFGASYFYGQVKPGSGPDTVLSAPKVTAKAVSRTSIRLSWKAVKGASGYVIYRSKGEVHAGAYKKIKTITSDKTTAYTDENCTKDSYYRYEVFAYRYKSGKKVYSQTAAAEMTAGVMKPDIGASPDSLESVLVYGHSSFADKLIFYRSADPDGPFMEIGESAKAECSILDEKVSFGQCWYYKVKAVRTINGRTYSRISDVAKGEVFNPYLQISVLDLNFPEEGKRDTFIYKLTSEKHNFPAVIYKNGSNEGEPFDYSYHGEKKTAYSTWESSTPVVLTAYSTDGIRYVDIEDTYVLEPGKSVYLKFQSADKVTYYKDCRISLDISYWSTGKRVDAGCLRLEKNMPGSYSYDY